MAAYFHAAAAAAEPVPSHFQSTTVFDFSLGDPFQIKHCVPEA
jgi:hypothetical protein